MDEVQPGRCIRLTSASHQILDWQLQAPFSCSVEEFSRQSSMECGADNIAHHSQWGNYRVSKRPEGVG
jgi:hypothetical protein